MNRPYFMPPLLPHDPGKLLPFQGGGHHEARGKRGDLSIKDLQGLQKKPKIFIGSKTAPREKKHPGASSVIPGGGLVLPLRRENIHEGISLKSGIHPGNSQLLSGFPIPGPYETAEMAQEKPLHPPMPPQTNALGGGKEHRKLSLPSQGMQQKIDIPHADHRADLPSQGLPEIQLTPDIPQKPSTKLLQEGSKTVLHDPSAGTLRRGGVNGNLLFSVSRSSSYQGKGPHLRRGKTLPQCPR
jgi:hypothetical protein